MIDRTPEYAPKRSVGSVLSSISLALGLGLVAVIIVVSIASSFSSRGEESEKAQASSVAFTSEERFVLVAQNSEPGLLAVSDSALLAGGQAVCDDLAAGTPMQEVFQNALTGMQLGDAGDDAPAWAGTIAASAVYELCPAYEDELKTLFP